MAKAKQKRAKAHHVVPQFYLNAWADEKSRLSMMDRTGKVVTTGSMVLGQQTDFYAMNKTDGDRDSVLEHTALRMWEGHGAVLHKRLLRGEFPLSDPDRKDFATFMALQQVRGKKSRQMMTEAHAAVQELAKQYSFGPADPTVPLPSLDAWPADDRERALAGLAPEARAALADRDTFSEDDLQNQLVRLIVNGVPPVAEALLETEWHLLSFKDGGPLLTSDEPISLHSEGPAYQAGLLGIGVGTAEYIQFPLSPDRCLVMTRGLNAGGDRARDAPPGFEEQVNALTAHGLWRQLFRHPAGDDFPEPRPLPERFFVQMN